MEKFKNTNILSAIGNTPIIRLNSVTEGFESEIYVKLEYLNPGGSIKDRMGVYMCQQAVKDGDLKPGGTIVECTSGNTGVGVALFANTYGYKCVFVMADKQSQEKIDNLKSFGAKVIVCPTNVEPEDPRSYYSVAAALAKLPNSFVLNQYANAANMLCHYNQTAPEIYEQTGGEFDTFMAAVGTGGTISGIGKYLKEKKPSMKVVGVDCKGSILAHFKKTGEMCEAHSYVLEGIGEDFLPENVHFDVIDDFVTVEDEESFQMTRRLLKEEGIYAGGSCGSAVVGAIRYAKTLAKPEKILTIMVDSGNRYAGKIYNDEWMKANEYQVNTGKDELDTTILGIIGENGRLV
ncbi:MAG: cysteine synthase family protein [Halobacteriovoraceae bacterium]|nr:cysteine synthase family protein [Halobacteriovoraceae bacterium]